VSDRSGLIALLIVAALGILLVSRRAVQRASVPEAVRVGGGIRTALSILAVLVAAGAGGWLFALVRSPAVGKVARSVGPSSVTAPVAGGVAFLLFAALGIFTARRVNGLWPAWTRAIPWSLSAMLGVTFVALTWRAQSLPVMRGSRYVLEHELVRFGALASGVIFLLGVLSAVLPWILDGLERRTFVPFVSARHVRATKSGFLTVISVLSICGVAVSSCALCSVVSIMGGFGADLKRKILGNNAHITVDVPTQLTGFDGHETMISRLRATPGVQAVTPVVVGEAMASSNANTAGTIVRGIDTHTIGDVIDLVKNIEYGRIEYLDDESRLAALPADEIIGGGAGGEPYRKGPDLSRAFGTDLDPFVRDSVRKEVTIPGIVVGRELARTLHLMVGDDLTLVSPLGDLGPMGVLPRSRKFRVAAIFYSGMYEYDASHVYLRQDVAQKFFSLEGKITTIDIKAADAEATEVMLPSIRAAVGDPKLRVRDWREMNKNLFSALKLERLATWVILCIAIMVASFCIICTLLLMVTEKGKEIAILKALGASDGNILAIFMSEGVIIGGIGTAFGVATGVATCVGLKWFGVRLDPDVYYIDRLPVATNAVDYVAVAISALVICTIATVYPAYAASSLRPVDGLRHE
jgi:lipoprotein-releasing system permease protein